MHLSKHHIIIWAIIVILSIVGLCLFMKIYAFSQQWQIASQLQNMGGKIEFENMNLSYISFQDTIFTDKHIELLKKIPQITCLGIHESDDFNADPCLGILSNLNNVTTLQMSGIGVSDRHILSLSGLTDLKKINFYLTPNISDVALKHLTIFPNLVDVRAYGCKITWDGVNYLQKSNPKIIIGWANNVLLEDIE